MPVKPSESEEEYFARQEIERRKRQQKEHAEKMAEEEKTRLRELHFMRCPKCGMDLTHFELKGIELDRCVSCGGTWFDHGEIDQLISQEQSAIKRVLSLFKE